MRYKLLDSGTGVLVDRTAVFKDIKSTFQVFFDMPLNADYIAHMQDGKGVTHKAIIRDGVINVPKELLKNTQPQYVELTVCQMDGDTIVKSWICEPMYISSFFMSQKTQWQISGGMTEEGALKRIAELEQTIVLLEETIIALKCKTEEHDKLLAKKKVIM